MKKVKIGYGYIYKKDLRSETCCMVYASIQELRLQCGEVPAKEIQEVEVRVKNG